MKQDQRKEFCFWQSSKLYYVSNALVTHVIPDAGTFRQQQEATRPKARITASQTQMNKIAFTCSQHTPLSSDHENKERLVLGSRIAAAAMRLQCVNALLSVTY